MPQQCCRLPHTPLPLCGVCVWCEGTLHSQVVAFCALPVDCQDMPRHVLVPHPHLLPLLFPRYCFLRHFLQAKAAQSFARTHAHRIAVVLHFSLRQLAAKVAAFHFFSFLPYLPHSTPPTAATRSQLGLVIHTKRHELVVVTVVVAVVAVTVVAVVSVAAVAADFLLACMRLVCNLIATRLCLGL